MLTVKSSVLGNCSRLLGFCLLFSLIACGTTPPSQQNNASPADAMAAAQAALDRMDGNGGQTTAAQGSSATQQPAGTQSTPSSQQGTVVNTGNTKPRWVGSVDSVYPRSQYIAMEGYASNREMAENNAKGNIASFFRQSIHVDTEITNTYQEAVKNGAADWSENLDYRHHIITYSSMDMYGVEIKEVWFDNKSTWYAVAVMEKAKAAPLYNEMIKANQDMINNLTAMTQTEKNSFEGYSRYQFAAAVAEMNVSYGNVLRFLDAPYTGTLTRGSVYKLEAESIASAIPIGIRVKNDSAGRIQGAFAQVITGLGFRSGGNNSRYVLDVDVTLTPEIYPGNTYMFSRIILTSDMKDTASNEGEGLIHYGLNKREGHNTQELANERAYQTAVSTINAEYKDKLSDYLSQLLRRN